MTSIAGDRYKGAMLLHLIRGRCALSRRPHERRHRRGGYLRGARRAARREVDLEPIVPSLVAGRGIGASDGSPSPRRSGGWRGNWATSFRRPAGGVRVAGSTSARCAPLRCAAGAGDAYLTEPAVLAADAYRDLRSSPPPRLRGAPRTRGPAPARPSWTSRTGRASGSGSRTGRGCPAGRPCPA